MDSAHNDDPSGTPYADLELGDLSLAEHSMNGLTHLVLIVGRTVARHEPIVALHGERGTVITTTGPEYDLRCVARAGSASAHGFALDLRDRALNDTATLLIDRALGAEVEFDTDGTPSVSVRPHTPPPGR